MSPATPIPSSHSPVVVILHLMLLPAFVASLVAALAWRRMNRGPARTVVTCVAVFLFFIPPLWLLLLGDHSILLVQQQRTVAVIAVLVLAVLFVHEGPKLLSRTSGFASHRARTRGGVTNVLLALLFGAGAMWLASDLLADTLRPRVVVTGAVERMWSSSGTRGRRSFYLVISGTRVQTTRDVYGVLRNGDRVVAEVGAGSGMVLRVERLEEQ